MSIGIYKVNNLFTIKRVSVCGGWMCMEGWMDRWMECFDGDVNRMVCGMGCVGVVG